MSTDGGVSFVLTDEFSGPVGTSGPLSKGEVSLSRALNDFSYSVTDSSASVIFRVEALSNGNGKNWPSITFESKA